MGMQHICLQHNVEASFLRAEEFRVIILQKLFCSQHSANRSQPMKTYTHKLSAKALSAIAVYGVIIIALTYHIITPDPLPTIWVAITVLIGFVRASIPVRISTQENLGQ